MTVRHRILAASHLRLCLISFLVFGTVLSALAAAPAQGIGAAHRMFQWRPFLAPFHAVVLHFPIGFITVAFILEIYRLRRPSEELRHVTMLVIWLSLVTGVVSATFGIL